MESCLQSKWSISFYVGQKKAVINSNNNKTIKNPIQAKDRSHLPHWKKTVITKKLDAQLFKLNSVRNII